MSSGEEKFAKLLHAIETGNREVLEALRADWREIRRYAEDSDVEVDLKDKQPALILWLSTPPVPESIDWVQLTTVPPSVLEEGTQQIQFVEVLWNSWLTQAIVSQLDGVLYPHVTGRLAWCRNAEAWFPLFLERVKKEEFANPQLRLDIVAGYSTFVDQLLFDWGEPISVRGDLNPPRLELPDGAEILPEDIGRAIEFRSGQPFETSRDLACAISLSLPVHQEVLPTVFVEVKYNCSLKSKWKDPLSPT